MKLALLLIFSILILLSACVSMPVSVTPGDLPVLPTSTLRVEPTASSVPSSTPTAFPTPTPTSTPEKLTGKMLIVVNNELRQLSLNDDSLKTLITRELFETNFPAIGRKDTTPYWSSILSPDGKNIVVFACSQFGFDCGNKRLYLGSTDLSRKVIIRTFAGGLLAWAPTSDKLIMQYSTDPRIKNVLSAAEDHFGKISSLPASDAAFWSFDGSQVYYSSQKGWNVVNSDGSQKKALECDLCANVSAPSSFAVAQSPDGRLIAIGLMDGTVIIASSDLGSFKIGLLGSYVNKIMWSPDGNLLAVDVRTSPNQSDVFILTKDGLIVKKIARPENAMYMNTCAWSPESKQIAFLALGNSGNDLNIQSLDQPNAIHLLSLGSENSSCPIWLSEN